MCKNNTPLQKINRVYTGKSGRNRKENWGAEFCENPGVVAIRVVAFLFRQNVTNEDHSLPFLSMRTAPVRHECIKSINLGRLVSRCILALKYQPVSTLESLSVGQLATLRISFPNVERVQNHIFFFKKSYFFHKTHASTTLACPQANTESSKN